MPGSRSVAHQLTDDEHTGRPTSCTSPETVARIQEIIRQDRRRTIRDIAGEMDVGYGTC